MGDVTNIEWADKTFNPWIGCTKVSPACDNCYAENLMDTRFSKVQWGGNTPDKGGNTIGGAIYHDRPPVGDLTYA